MKTCRFKTRRLASASSSRRITDGPQLVTKRGAEAAVLASIAEWRRLKATARPSLKQLLSISVGPTRLTQPRSRPQAEGHRVGIRRMYLLDTNVVPNCASQDHGAVVATTADADLNWSAVTLGEIQAGIELTRERDASALL